MCAAARQVLVRETPIALSALLKFSGLAETGGAAKQAVADGEVRVNGKVETRKGRKLQVGDEVTYRGETVVVGLG